VNLSILLPADSTTAIPVSCVEAGRWRTTTPSFQSAGRVHFSAARAQKLEQVSASLRVTGVADSDQSSVWDAISTKSARMNVSSPTAAMAALFESRHDDMRAFADALRAEPGQFGAVYAIGSALIGVELFDSAATFGKAAEKLVTSYAIDAVEATSAAAPPDTAAVTTFLDQVGSATRDHSSSVGLGTNVRLSGPEVVGAGLVWEDSCIHLAAFRRPEGVGNVDRRVSGARMQSWCSRARRS